MRSSRAEIDVSASGRVRRTSATSSGMRWSGASWMPTKASPSTSRARVAPAGPSRSAWAVTRARSWSGSRVSSIFMAARNTSRRREMSCSPSSRGLRPASRARSTAISARPVSRSHRASTSSSRASPSSGRPPGHHLVEGRLHVAGRAGPGPHHVVDGLGTDVEPGVVDDVAGQLGQLVGRQQVQLEVLGAAADGGQHLLRVGGGQHEHHVLGGLLERLQQRVRRRRRQHVDLVEDVHLRAPGRAHGRLGDEVADGLDPVVGGGVELVHVERRAVLDGQARLADAARLAVGRVRAVEDLGQDAGGRGLARAPGAAEQVGVAHPIAPDRVLQGRDQVVLAPDLGESLRPVAAVERLVGHRRPSLPVPIHRRSGDPRPRGNGRTAPRPHRGTENPLLDPMGERQNPLPHVMVRRSAAHTRSR